ncbi:MAG: Rrf2 family transcriptional regulator [bacterium]|nr:Rrf2 family transcriptional regulator [bacterium]
MKLGNQVEWAIHCMELLARVPDGVYIPTKVLAKFHGIPKEYLSKALQALALAKLIDGTLGPKGGYRIARKPSKISLLEIVEAVEGSKKTFHCQEIRLNNPCLPKKRKQADSICAVASAMYQADEAWRKVLREKKLSDIIRGVDRQVPPELMAASTHWIQSALD